MKTAMLLAFVATLSLVSCATDAASKDDPAPGADAIPSISPGSVEAAVLLAGTDGKREEPALLVARDARAFASAWRGVAGFNIPVPPIDFDSRMVAVVFMGRKTTGGWGYSLRSAEAGTDGIIALTLDLRSPDPDGSVTMALTSPFIMVSLPLTAADPAVVILD